MSDAPIYPVLLLVEDDHLLQIVLDEDLSGEGFEVVKAASGSAAIKELEANPARFKALITDVRLGKGPNGWAVGHRARELMSGLPVIYMSGDSVHDWSANGVPESVILQKPFVIAQLITAVTSLLNQASKATALREAMVTDANTKSSSA